MTTSTTSRMITIHSTLTELRERELAALRPHPYNGEYPETMADALSQETGFRLREDYCLDAIEIIHGHLHRIYRSGDYVGITYAGSLVYEPCGSREWNYDTIDKDADLVVGCPTTAYGYKLREGRVLRKLERHTALWTWDDMSKVLDELERQLPFLIRRVEEIEAAAAERRKNFGKSINDQFRALGIDKSARETWWNMPWKKEVTPETFVTCIRKAESDPKRFALALACNSRKDLEQLEWMVRPSVPRTEALLRAVAKVTDIKPATEREWKEWKTQPRKWLFE